MKIRCKIAVGFLVILGAIIGVFLFCNFTLFLAGNSFLEGLTETKGVFVKSDYPMSRNDQYALNILLHGGHVLTHNELLEVLSNFYNSIINNLIVVISLLGVIVYFSVNSLSRKHAEEIAEKSVSREFQIRLANKEFVEGLLNSSDALSSYIKDADKISSLQENISGEQGLEKRLEAVEYHLMSMDDGAKAKNSGSKKKKGVKNGGNKKKQK